MTEPNPPRLAAERAVEWVQDGDLVGLGTGRAAAAFVEALARQVEARGVSIRTVASSVSTEQLARGLGLSVLPIESCGHINITVDGADEVDTERNMIKGLGGALLREKVLASMSERYVICVGADKLAARLGQRGVLPVEVVPFAVNYCQQRIRALGVLAAVRRQGDLVFQTDNGHAILDCRIGVENDHAELERALRLIPGVVETGYFLGFRPIVVVEEGNRVSVREG